MRGKPRLWIVISIILALAVLGLGGFAWHLASRQGQLSQRAASLEAELDELNQELDELNQELADRLAEVEGQFSTRLALAERGLRQQLLSVEDGLSGRIVQAEEAFEVRVAQAEEALSGQMEQVEQSFSQELSSVQMRLKEEFEGAAGQLQGLQGQTARLADQMDRALLDASQLYEQVKVAVVEVRTASPSGVARGAGFLYGAGGLYIVTAYHVVAGATGLKALTSKGEEVSASVLGYDAAWDVAVLKLAQPLSTSPLPLADSGEVSRGQPAMALGSPFGYAGSVTTGIVSNLGFPITYEGRSLRFSPADAIQFDAAANPGNSGGPLFNVRGQVIGMVVARVKPEDGWGIGFAVPANYLKEAVEAILKRG